MAVIMLSLSGCPMGSKFEGCIGVLEFQRQVFKLIAIIQATVHEALVWGNVVETQSMGNRGHICYLA